MRLGEIRIYPVKGLRGIPLSRAVVEPWGLAGDRRYMLVDDAGRVLTQRQWPGMAVIATRLGPHGLVLSAKDRGEIAIAEPEPDGRRGPVTIWRDSVMARDCGSEAAAWLSAALGTPVRLVHMPDPARARPVDPDFCDPGDVVTFADGFPLLVTNRASLDALEARIGHRLGMDRFRPNLVVESAEAWAEDGWQRLRVGAVAFAGTKDCARCAVTTVDQDTGERSAENEPLRTLAGIRRNAAGRIIFGQNLIPRTLGCVALGDAVTTFAGIG